MRSIGYAGAAALVLGLAAFSLQGRTTMRPELASPTAASAELAPVVVGAPDPLRQAAAEAVGTVEARSEETTAAEDAGGEARGERPSDERSRDATRRDADERSEDRAESSSDDNRRRRYRRGRRYEPPLPPPEAWSPPEGPVKIALQAGHWRAHEAPPELEGLKSNGTRFGDMLEWEANLAIAKATAAKLEAKGYEVEILPAVVPPGYRAHLFIAIHADGSNDPAATGWRAAAPRRDATHRAGRMVELLQETYGAATGLARLPTVTRRMQSYYAFNSRRYDHALHPMTIAVILETGFLTSAADRRVIVDNPDRVAQGIVDAVVRFPETPPPSLAEPPGAGGPGSTSGGGAR